MSSKLTILTFAAIISICYGVERSNYDISRNRINGARNGAGYSQYPYGQHPGQYPSGPGVYPGGQYQGHYGGQYGGQYGNYHPGLEGPPGAHPGCPLCDMSVYSYCSRKQAHDSCCCENSGYHPFSCRRTDCKFLYANSCEEYHLITNCCCVDLEKNAVVPSIVAAPVVA
ncbi:uncharacterized protein LOC126776125 [Nymphalis io]|uniref:uncharacterized protein LOC126776125 n=1 Tax=Inachis io TaxID=171585 RepID=UPI00216A6B05|nr:uncharacterized protein LOC126776125 [Nymphalis io]XP_050354378.1 uncharacterized protein LOC126776125 [Nymphalis io]XP_050354379.1 uncharacterized protein LOC126776125 [Nymphalis io]XP_050354380.1 uncharacterized protein LOC126776125 [Nymphalis io]XP_050354381.1 uncharacterized protein LOC126776125 [Nymphalis io]XP_050354382.1 uncharacterized protein LOC126776125 [Nymphalis io]XP_050354383.1 uncharacterized protein LOC126776125 [Nymphalis io]